MKNLGFTLFETLLTLAIIGVVSALTIPALVNNHQNHIAETSLHKFYNDLDRAVENYMAEQHVDDLSESDLAESAQGLTEFVNKYFKIQKNCGTRYYENEGNSCFARYYKRLNNNDTIDLTRNQCNIVFRTTNGMAVCMDTATMETINPDSDSSIQSDYNIESELGVAIGVEVDINGPQGPNILGRDFFNCIAVMRTGRITTNPRVPDSYFNRIYSNNWKMDY